MLIPCAFSTINEKAQGISIPAYSAAAQERFWSKVDASGDCWIWRGTDDGKGYGVMHLGRTTTTAHRFAYTLLVGPIPPGLQIDHLCRNRACVNPDHMEPVTQRVNSLRSSLTPSGRNAR